MLTSLHVERFRCFRSLTLRRLGRVNLFVGLNNAGKTSALDAAEILLERGEWSVFRRQAKRRGEMLHRGDSAEADIRHLFHGHQLVPGTSFLIEGEQGEPERVEVAVSSTREEEDSDGTLVLNVASREGERHRRISALGGLLFPGWVVRKNPPVRFLGTGRIDDAGLGSLWDRVVLTDEEAKVTDALRIIEPGIERIAYAKQEGTTDDEFLFKLAGTPERVPLGSMGDGIKRLLALSLHLARCAGNALLIDEIDTGLHYSVMVRMWRLVLETARRLDVQVFATTHSLDCILAVAELCERSPELAGDVLLHRIERDVPEAVTYTADALRVAAAQQMEVRGHAAEAE